MTNQLAANSPDGGPAIGMLGTELHLTRRQAEVLCWLAEGKTNEEIATILECSFFTVKTHVKEIFRRLGVPNRAGAISTALHVVFSGSQGLGAASPERAMVKKNRG